MGDEQIASVGDGGTGGPPTLHELEVQRARLFVALPLCRQMAALRTAAGVSQGEAAGAMGLSRPALSAAENGRRGWGRLLVPLLGLYEQRAAKNWELSPKQG